METKRTGLFENGLIWFGAGVSIAEILTGTYLAPLGMKKGIAAIILGHIIGCLMLFLAGVIGGKVRKSAMETVKMSFGQKGSVLFAVFSMTDLHHRIKLPIFQNQFLICNLPANLSDKSTKMRNVRLRLQDHFLKTLPDFCPVNKDPLHERAAHSCDHKSVALSRFQCLKTIGLHS